MNSSTASVALNGGADSDEEDEDDEPVDYNLGNLIAIGPTKSGKTTAINNLLLNPCFGNLARYDTIIFISKHCSDNRHWMHRNLIIRALSQATAVGVNIICSDGGWTPQDQRPKIVVLKRLLYPDEPYQGSTLVILDDFPDLLTNDKDDAPDGESKRALGDFWSAFFNTDASSMGYNFWVTLQRNKQPFLPAACRNAFESFILFDRIDDASLKDAIGCRLGLYNPGKDLKYMLRYTGGHRHNFILVAGGGDTYRYYTNLFDHEICKDNLGQPAERNEDVPPEVMPEPALLRFLQRRTKLLPLQIAAHHPAFVAPVNNANITNDAFNTRQIRNRFALTPEQRQAVATESPAPTTCDNSDCPGGGTTWLFMCAICDACFKAAADVGCYCANCNEHLLGPGNEAVSAVPVPASAPA